MITYKLKKPYRIIFWMLGVVFLGFAACMWVYDARFFSIYPEKASFRLLMDFIITIIGFLILLRPWRYQIGIDEGRLHYADGFMPCRHYSLSSIKAVYSQKDRHMVIYLNNAPCVNIEYNFNDIEGFLNLLASRGITITDTKLCTKDRKV